MRVTAYDPDDDQLTYSIDHDGVEFFIDAFSGEIYFRYPASEQRDYEFRVYADDGLHRSDPSTVRVHLDRRSDGVEQSRSRRDVRPLRLVEIPEVAVTSGHHLS